MFLLAFFGIKIIDFKNCFNSVALPSNKDLDCIVSFVNWIPCSVLSVKFYHLNFLSKNFV